MKKLVFVFAAMLVSWQGLKAQTWSEWWAQKKTQIKYLGQQIAALKVYTGYLEKGYDIAKDGLGVIHDIKTGDFNLHNDYFSSLKTVNPAVKDSVKLNDIDRLRRYIIAEQQNCTHLVDASQYFNSHEVAYIRNVCKQLLSLLDGNMDELHLLTTDGNLAMKDDERVNRIDAIQQDVKDKYVFIRHLGSGIQKLRLQRMKEQTEIQRMKALHGR